MNLENDKNLEVQKLFELCEKFNWDTIKIINATQIPINIIRNNINEYIKKFNIPITTEKILFFLDNPVKDFFINNPNILQNWIIKREITTTGDLSYINKMLGNAYIRNYMPLSDLDNETVLKVIYDKCEDLSWNEKILNSYFKLPINMVKKGLCSYIATKKQPLNESAFNFLLYRDSKRLLIDHKNIIEFLLKNNIVNKVDLMNPKFINEELRNKICEFCYKIADKYDWLKEDFEKYCNKYGLNSNTYLRMADEYVTDILKKDSAEYIKTQEKQKNAQKYHEKIKWEKHDEKLRKSPPQYAIALNTLLNSNNNEKIIEIITKYGPAYLKSMIPRYVSLFHNGSIDIEVQLNKKFDVYYANKSNKPNTPSKYVAIFDKILSADENNEVIRIIKEAYNVMPEFKKYKYNYVLLYHDKSKKIEEEIDKKLELYSKYMQQEKQKQKITNDEEKKYNNLSVARQIINHYINNGYKNINDFCLSNDVTITKFNECVKIIMELDNDLYNKYDNYVNNIKSQNFAILMSRVSNLIQLIKNGVEENGIKREFDMVDYYKHTKLNFDELIRVSGDKISPEDYRVLRTFIAKNKDDKELSPNDIHNIYNQKNIVNVEFDNKGNIIPGTGREITKEEKERIIKYLKLNNIPITKKTYNIIYKRWLSGELNLGEENKQIK